MALQPEFISVDDLEAIDDVVDVMASFTQRGRGWINVSADVADDAVRQHRSSLTGFFRRSSPEVALGTWMPSPLSPPGSPQQLGVQHALGTRIAPFLDEWGLPLRPEWRRVQDSPRRGLLVEAPADASPGEVLRWLLGVTRAATVPETLGSWTLSVYRGRDG